MIENADQFVAEVMEFIQVVNSDSRKIGNVTVEIFHEDYTENLEVRACILYGKPFANGYSYEYFVKMGGLAGKLVSREIFDKLSHLIKPYESNILMGQFIPN